ncbi:hypothetical protein FBU31_004572 [Coemansia sp. 'formosensis']|nr:hypothetical protein FBU31_004572 [Coemansia sp. 'formosensis']
MPNPIPGPAPIAMPGAAPIALPGPNPEPVQVRQLVTNMPPKNMSQEQWVALYLYLRSIGYFH